MLSFEEFQATVSAEKNLLTFEQFKTQVLTVFKCHGTDCNFDVESIAPEDVSAEFVEDEEDEDSETEVSYSYAFMADLYFPKYPNTQFVVKYVIDHKNCNYGRWIVIKLRYEKICKNISNSLAQALSVVAQKTEENIKEEIALFNHIQN